MTFIHKILDMLNMDNWDAKDKKEILAESSEIEREQILSFLQSKIDAASKMIEFAKNISDKTEFDKYINEIMTLFSEFSSSATKEEHLAEDKANNPYDKYYENIRKQREINLNISYDDIKVYDMKPFDLKGKIVSDGNFTAIELSENNLKIAYNCLKEINRLLLPYQHLYEDAEFPNRISVEYISNGELPISHLRLIPYTATKRKSKYPLGLWLSNSGYYGTEYTYVIYFDKEGEIGQCELSLHGFNGGISYETKIRRNDDGIYILRISKTLYSPPYGTTTIYHCRDNENTSKSATVESNARQKSKRMSKYEIEQYARECNAYVIREDRKEKQ